MKRIETCRIITGKKYVHLCKARAEAASAIDGGREPGDVQPKREPSKRRNGGLSRESGAEPLVSAAAGPAS
jgi:hypothetical protein